VGLKETQSYWNFIECRDKQDGQGIATGKQNYPVNPV
jgi:hypothetical protein